MGKHFEGWYFKHEKDGETVCFIVGRSMEKAFVQVVANGFYECFDYPAESYKVCKKHFQIRIGDNLFCKYGCVVMLKNAGTTVKGRLKYTGVTPPKKDIMGWFRYVPFMECRHSVVSMSHRLVGNLYINGQETVFDGGRGYIEGDKGKSFPTEYIWCQCNGDESDDSAFMAIATVPLGMASFKGVVCNAVVGGKEYRLATYFGAKADKLASGTAVIKQGILRLEVDYSGGERYRLSAPATGRMTRKVDEHINGEVAFRLFREGEKVFDLSSKKGCYEVVEK